VNLAHRSGDCHREAGKVDARLSHPNVVTIFDIGEDDGQRFSAMEFLGGPTLWERIAESPPAFSRSGR